MNLKVSRAVCVGSLVLAGAGGTWLLAQLAALYVAVQALGSVVAVTLG